MKLLIVDDNNEILEFHKSLLTRNNIEVITANSGKEALKIAAVNPPDLIISDIFMPGMNGFTLCKLWNETDKLKNIPFLFFTSVLPDKTDEEFALKLGARKFLQKPINPEKLPKELNEIFNTQTETTTEAEAKTEEEIAEFYKEFGRRLLEKTEKELSELKTVNENLTKTLRENEKIKEQTEKLKKRILEIIDSWPYVVIVHKDGEFKFVNNRAVETLEASSKEELLGKKIAQFVHPDYFLTIQERMLRMQKGEQVETIVEKLLTLDKKVIEFEVSAFVLEEGDNPSFLAIGYDVTEANRKKRLSDALNKAGHTLLRALSRNEVFNVMAQELIQYDITTILLLVDDTKEYLTTSYKHFNSKKLKLLETLIGGNSFSFRFPINLIDPDMSIREKRKASYRPDFLKKLSDSLNEPQKTLSANIQKMLGLKESLVCPLFVNDEFIGILSFQSPDIRETDVDIFSTFANEFALAWRNVDLMEKMQKEIEERKNAEIALYESEFRFKTLADISQVFIYVISGNRPVYANESVIKITGYTAEELLGMNFWEIVHPDYREKVKKIGFARQRGEDVPSRYTFPIITKDGRTVWLDYSASVTKINDKTIIVGTAIDITQQKEALEKLKESEEKFKTLADTTSTAIFVYAGTKFVYGNKASFELTGYPEEEFLQKNFWDFVHPDYKEMIRQRGLARQRGEKIPNRYEFKIVRKDGEERWIDFTAGKINWGGVAASIGTAVDITARKLAEEKNKQNKKS